jgi:hypothetical protein
MIAFTLIPVGRNLNPPMPWQLVMKEYIYPKILGTKLSPFFVFPITDALTLADDKGHQVVLGSKSALKTLGEGTSFGISEIQEGNPLGVLHLGEPSTSLNCHSAQGLRFLKLIPYL